MSDFDPEEMVPDYDYEEPQPYEPAIGKIRQPREDEARKITAILIRDSEKIQRDPDDYAFRAVEKLVWIITDLEGNRKNDIEKAVIYGHAIKSMCRKLQEQEKKRSLGRGVPGVQVVKRLDLHPIGMQILKRREKVYPRSVDTQTEREEISMDVDADKDPIEVCEGIQGFQELFPALNELIRRVVQLEERQISAGESDHEEGHGPRDRSAVETGGPKGKLGHGGGRTPRNQSVVAIGNPTGNSSTPD